MLPQEQFDEEDTDYRQTQPTNLDGCFNIAILVVTLVIIEQRHKHLF
jgi:hypothetical protein